MPHRDDKDKDKDVAEADEHSVWRHTPAPMTRRHAPEDASTSGNILPGLTSRPPKLQDERDAGPPSTNWVLWAFGFLLLVSTGGTLAFLTLY